MRGGVTAGGYLVRPRPGLTGILILVGFAIGGCSSRPSSSVLVPITAAVGGGKSVSILAATTRTRSHDDDEAFTNGRARAVNYEQYAISIPPDHVSGQIEWPAQIPGNPERDFVVTSAQQLDVTHSRRPSPDGWNRREASEGTCSSSSTATTPIIRKLSSD
jgi:hypothetical protein